MGWPIGDSHESHMCVTNVIMGWLWLVGSIKLYVSFPKEPYKRDNILHKRPIILIDPTDRRHPIHHTGLFCRIASLL